MPNSKGDFLVLAPSFSQPPAKVKTAKPSIDLHQVPADSPSPSTPKDLRQANPAHPPPLALHQVSRNYTRELSTYFGLLP
ncbi:hypothetical protein ATANTOWER_025107 [Ataeniobius toweri]|uniref:Uncharacterized protein n=1 Tax=Ataeniobius toweri TaxID=208326 RepID=A0ABU7B220_9TELE|nr:hypothetical protein [Ataeniobius toweri]